MQRGGDVEAGSNQSVSYQLLEQKWLGSVASVQACAGKPISGSFQDGKLETM
jgi:hypothetical protein